MTKELSKKLALDAVTHDVATASSVIHLCRFFFFLFDIRKNVTLEEAGG